MTSLDIIVNYITSHLWAFQKCKYPPPPCKHFVVGVDVLGFPAIFYS